ncbi:hypothetical protein COV61_00050 [Candidatus Micrarchaeota archaeon CG11_big_fil_rev_8_21_14_0_20_47_5]|nr:MAG: hypothetical protein AUJ17_04255 [Candidatus Micrarchaeota archaeon CG1_02_47_40]PIN84463.1 MAG: hypothetical protein COV61_00050 [Candidatus Micrarchaeota archaeon CG11_big_fil_rev_8_21_14_0_20_47_5]
MIDFLKNLSLDAWYKCFVYLGGIGFLMGLFIPIQTKIISNEQLLLFSFGLFLIGVGAWREWKKIYPYDERRPTEVDGIMQGVGVILLIVSIIWVFLEFVLSIIVH